MKPPGGPARVAASGSATQSGQSDRDEPADRGLGRQAAGCREGVEAVGGELVRRDIIPDVASLVPEFGEMFEMAGDLTFVPGEQDGLDVWEILAR